MYIGLVIQGGEAVGVMFAPNFESFTAPRFILGAVSIGGLIAQFILSELKTHFSSQCHVASGIWYVSV